MAIGVIDRGHGHRGPSLLEKKIGKGVSFHFPRLSDANPDPNSNPLFDLGPQDPYLLFGSLQDLVDLLELNVPLIYNIHRQLGSGWTKIP
ncbi:hypothetical protein PRUPE_1G332400 [Prunus persica]|uniref:Uncharacterized protein n=1 Tax=Prunus persica TaxID=3760 RepID=M5XFZ1_PRUPE|nr:hypothetical protein PRUPE_1G332400 [Prunus persica]